MALKVGIVQSSEVSKWRQFKNTKGEVQAEFKTSGIAYKPFFRWRSNGQGIKSHQKVMT